MTNSLHPITVVTRVSKCKWEVVDADLSGLKPDFRQRAWLGRCCSARSPYMLGRWCWSSNNQALLNYQTAQIYWSLTKFDKPADREPIPPSWKLGIRQQNVILQQLWCSPGVIPKTAAVGWRMLQRALPNADRWTGFYKSLMRTPVPAAKGIPETRVNTSCTTAKKLSLSGTP